MLSAVLIGVAATTMAVLGAGKRRKVYRQIAQGDAQGDLGLPPVSKEEALAIMANAEQAAIRKSLGGPGGANPHPKGTRAHIIWEGHYGATLLAWDE